MRRGPADGCRRGQETVANSSATSVAKVTTELARLVAIWLERAVAPPERVVPVVAPLPCVAVVALRGRDRSADDGCDARRDARAIAVVAPVSAPSAMSPPAIPAPAMAAVMSTAPASTMPPTVTAVLNQLQFAVRGLHRPDRGARGSGRRRR